MVLVFSNSLQNIRNNSGQAVMTVWIVMVNSSFLQKLSRENSLVTGVGSLELPLGYMLSEDNQLGIQAKAFESGCSLHERSYCLIDI